MNLSPLIMRSRIQENSEIATTIIHVIAVSFCVLSLVVNTLFSWNIIDIVSNLVLHKAYHNALLIRKTRNPTTGTSL